MATELALRCDCGALRGTAAPLPGLGQRIVCYCDDCQLFVHALGPSTPVLDAHGGTEVFQTSPAALRFTEGSDQLACLRLRPGGILRWYAACCRTPIANTVASPQVPFAGLIHSSWARAQTPDAIDPVLGPIRARIFGRFATGDREGLAASDRLPTGLLLRSAGRVLGARWRGEHRRSPFFRDGAPLAEPRILPPDELAAAERKRASA